MKNTRFTSLLFLSLVFFYEIQAQQLVLSPNNDVIQDTSTKINTHISNTDIFYYSDGTIKEIRKTTNDKLHGSWKLFYANGQLKKEGTFENDKAQGAWKIYSENGVLLYIENYKKGIEHGNWKAFHSNGKTKIEGAFVDGKRQGAWKVYHPSGVIAKIIIFEDDQEKSELILKETFINPSLFSLNSSISNY